MRRIALFLILLIPIIGNSQSPDKLEKLKRDLQNATTSKDKGFVAIEIAKRYHDVNPDSVLHYSRLAIHYGTKSRNKSILASGYQNKGVGLRKIGLIEEALELFLIALKLREELQEPDKIASSLLSVGNIRFAQGELAIANSQYDIADERFIQSLGHYQQGLIQAKKSRDSILISKSYENLGSVYFNIYDTLCEFNYDYERSIEYYKLSYELYPALDREWVYAELETNILACKIEMGSYENLESEYKKILRVIQKNKQKEQLIELNFNYSAALLDTEPNKALKLLKEAYLIAKELDHRLYLIKTNRLLYHFYKNHNNNTKALRHYEEYSSLSVELTNSKTKVKIEEMGFSYQREKDKRKIFEEKIKTAKAETDKKTAETDKRFFKWSLFGMILFLIAAFAFFLQRLYIQKLRRKQQQEEHQQEVNSLLTNQELKTMEAMLEGQEVERKRIAEDLHDRLGSTLSAAKMYFEVTLPSSPEETRKPEQLKAYELLDRAIQDTREISHNLVSGALSKFGLEVALRDLKNTIEGASDVTVKLKIDVLDERFHRDIEIQIYRIIQELFSNSLKHANPTKLFVRITQNSRLVDMIMSDDGTGYDSRHSHQGMGLKNIQGRVSKLGGSIKTSSSKTKGTMNKITFELKDND